MSTNPNSRPLTRRWLAAAAGLALLVTGAATARAEHEGYARTGGGDYSYLSYRTGEVAVAAASYGGRSYAARTNQPLVVGDRLSTSRNGRAELIMADGTIVWIDSATNLYLANVANTAGRDDRETLLDMQRGRVALRVAPDAEFVRIDLPRATVYLEPGGTYRVEAMGRNTLAVAAHEGNAEIVTREFSEYVFSGESLVVDEYGEPNFGGIRDFALSGFDRWVASRQNLWTSGSSRYVSGRLSYSSSMLDRNGSWQYLDEYGTHGWRPRVASNWRPYTQGTWYSTPMGLTWQASEPWGWVPYHYGTWALSSRYGWVWIPGETYSPAWVYWYSDRSHLGWAPIGYYDLYHRDMYRGGGGFGYGSGVRVGGSSSSISISIGFRPELTGSHLDFGHADMQPWNFVRVADFNRVTPAADVAHLIVPRETVRRTIQQQHDRGTLIAEPLVIQPQEIRSQADVVRRTAVRSTPAQRENIDATPIFRRDDSQKLPEPLRERLTRRAPQTSTAAVVEQQRQRGAQPPPVAVATPDASQSAASQSWRAEQGNRRESRRQRLNQAQAERAAESGTKPSASVRPSQQSPAQPRSTAPQVTVEPRRGRGRRPARTPEETPAPTPVAAPESQRQQPRQQPTETQVEPASPAPGDETKEESWRRRGRGDETTAEPSERERRRKAKAAEKERRKKAGEPEVDEDDDEESDEEEEKKKKTR